MELKVAIIGLGVFGRELALRLVQRGVSVLAIDRDRALVEAIKEDVTGALIMDATDEAALHEAGIDSMPVVVCAIGNEHVEGSILTTALLYKLGVRRIIARAGTQLHARILKQVGAHEVLNPEEAMALRLAHQIARPGLEEILPLEHGVCVAHIPVPEQFVGNTLAKLDVRRRYGINVVGIQHMAATGNGDTEAATMLFQFSPRDRLRDGDRLLVVGREDEIQALGTKD